MTTPVHPPDTPTEAEYTNIPAIAKRLGISETSTRKLASQGAFGLGIRYKANGQKHYLVDTVDKFLAKRVAAARAEKDEPRFRAAEAREWMENRFPRRYMK